MKASGDWFIFSTRPRAPKVMYGFPDSIKGWKGRFLFIEKTAMGITGELKWRVTGKVKDPLPGPGEYDATSVKYVSPLIFNYAKLTERVLIAACMRPMPALPAFPLKKNDKSKRNEYDRYFV